MESAGSVDDPLRPQIGGVRAARRPEEMLPAALHPAVEGTPIRGIALIRRQSLRNPAYQTLAPATPRRTLPLFPIPTFLSGASYTARSPLDSRIHVAGVTGRTGTSRRPSCTA